jgi:NAD(P) transhydrogenase subunit beta
VLICNYDASPGYAGVNNPLYNMPHVSLMFGDAADTLKVLLDKLK